VLLVSRPKGPLRKVGDSENGGFVGGSVVADRVRAIGEGDTGPSWRGWRVEADVSNEYVL